MVKVPKPHPDINMREVDPDLITFDRNDVLAELIKVSRNKAVGPDGVHIDLLLRKVNKKKGEGEITPIGEEVVKKIVTWLNIGCWPDYLNDGRMIMFSKTNSDTGQVN